MVFRVFFCKWAKRQVILHTRSAGYGHYAVEEGEDEGPDGDQPTYKRKKFNATMQNVHAAYVAPSGCKTAETDCRHLSFCNGHKWKPIPSCHKAVKKCTETNVEEQKILPFCKECLQVRLPRPGPPPSNPLPLLLPSAAAHQSSGPRSDLGFLPSFSRSRGGK